MEIVLGRYEIRLDMCGRSRLTRKMFRRKRWKGARQRRLAKNREAAKAASYLAVDRSAKALRHPKAVPPKEARYGRSRSVLSWRGRKDLAPTRARAAAPHKRSYCSDLGSERFLGECWLSKDTSSWPEAGTPAFPLPRISFTVNLRP